MFRFLLIYFALLFASCQEQPSQSVKKVSYYKKITGKTMGVVAYNITYEDKKNQIKQSVIDSLLNALNMGSSHYEKNSTISRFNDSEYGIIIKNSGYDQHFIKNILIAKKIVEKTNGYFDPTVGPLMNYYGFKNKKLNSVGVIDTIKVKKIMEAIGFDKINIEQEGNQFTIQKTNRHTQLDFSAIAKGYAIDEVGRFLEEQGVENYLVDIGGEALGIGKNAKGNWWNIAIQDPKAPRGYYHNQTITLVNQSMATSANYENFRIINGKKMGHTMNPKTGFPELNDLLSATVVAKDCSVADSYATAFMAMGMEKAFNLAQNLPEIEAYLLYLDENGETAIKYTIGLSENIKALYKNK